MAFLFPVGCLRIAIFHNIRQTDS